MHTVETGETLASIGKRYRMTPASIAAVNRMQSQAPAVGDHLLIPAVYHETEPVKTASAKRAHTTASKRHKPATHTASHAKGKGKATRAAAFPQSSAKLARAQR